jgi:hypothetical protein
MREGDVFLTTFRSGIGWSILPGHISRAGPMRILPGICLNEKKVVFSALRMKIMWHKV